MCIRDREIPEHARHNFTGIAHVVADELVGNPERMGAFDGCFLQQEEMCIRDSIHAGR